MQGTGGSRDHGWTLAGAAIPAAVVAALVAAVVAAVAATAALEALGGLEGRGPQRSGPDRKAVTDEVTRPSTSTKMDRVPVGALLPNLVMLPAEELGITARDGRRVLRFASVLANEGSGPLQVSPVPDEACPSSERYVEQRVFRDADDDGAFDRRRDRGTVALPGGCMVFHPRHEHWHFDASAGYALTTVTDEEPIVAQDKVSFCLRDSEPLEEATVRHRRTYPDCARDRRQGITVGWADRYDAETPGQRLVLPPGLGNGVFCLRLEVDPFDLLQEADEDDNTSAVVVRINRRDVRREPGLTC